MVVYILSRAGVVVGVYELLLAAKAYYPGEWVPVHNGPIRAPEEWSLGDAKITKEYVR